VPKANLPNPPACASIIDVATGMPWTRPSSPAAFALRPDPHRSPGVLTSLPDHNNNNNNKNMNKH